MATVNGIGATQSAPQGASTTAGSGPEFSAVFDRFNAPRETGADSSMTDFLRTQVSSLQPLVETFAPADFRNLSQVELQDKLQEISNSRADAKVVMSLLGGISGGIKNAANQILNAK